MEIYLVGGAVRDKLLGLPVKERDWVVVGATPADMLAKGYRQVGKDFPVFLHPETQEEYALARLERKVAKGYTGFQFDASPSVTLEEDLLRRDLTINAIAEHLDGGITDPFNGQADIQNKILRHVSLAFKEDPVRILRLGRFAARFNCLQFKVATETVDLMREMVESGEVNALVPERVWKEWERALGEKNPEAFFQVLESCGALTVLFPQVEAGDVEMLAKAAILTNDQEVRFATLFYNKPIESIQSLFKRYRVPSPYRELAVLVSSNYLDYIQAENFTATQWVDFFHRLDAFRRESRFKKILESFGILSALNSRSNVNDLCFRVYDQVRSVDVKTILESKLVGKEIADAIRLKRVQHIEIFLKEHKARLRD